MTIQSEIDATSSGGTLKVSPRSVRENLTISRPITLIADGLVRVDGSGGWNVVHVMANFVTIEGFELYNGQGDGIEANNVHHLTVRRCHLHHNGESGIQTNRCDIVTIEECLAEYNARSGWFSGISLYQQKNIGGAHAAEFRNVIRNSVSRFNVTTAGQHTDGNGIILDDFQGTQPGGGVRYPHKTLIDNCLVHDNGGKGVQVVWSDYVAVRRVTSYQNGRDPLDTGTWRGELSGAMGSVGGSFDACIAVAVRGAGRLGNNRAYLDTSTQETGPNVIAWGNNIGWDTTATPSTRIDGNEPIPGITWLDPQLGADFVPANPAAANHGWRPGGIVVPPPPPDPEPEPEVPTLEDVAAALDALKAAMAAALADIDTRLARIEAQHPEPDALLARVTDLERVVMDLRMWAEKISATDV